jgi:hypothetical protein
VTRHSGYNARHDNYGKTRRNTGRLGRKIEAAFSMGGSAVNVEAALSKSGVSRSNESDG